MLTRYPHLFESSSMPFFLTSRTKVILVVDAVMTSKVIFVLLGKFIVLPFSMLCYSYQTILEWVAYFSK